MSCRQGNRIAAGATGHVEQPSHRREVIMQRQSKRRRKRMTVEALIGSVRVLRAHFAALPAPCDAIVGTQVLGTHVLQQRVGGGLAVARPAQHRYPVELTVLQKIGPCDLGQLKTSAVLNEVAGGGQGGCQRSARSMEQPESVAELLQRGWAVAQALEQAELIGCKHDW